MRIGKQTKLAVIPCLLFLSFHFLHAQDIPEVYTTLEKYHQENDFEACIKMEKEIEAFATQRKDTLASNSYFYIGDAYIQLDKQVNAVIWWEREKALLSELALPEHYSTSLYNLADLYLKVGDYHKAGPVADELISLDRKIYGTDSEEFVFTVLSVADIYYQLDRITDSKSILKSTIDQQENGSINQGLLLNKLGDLYTYTGEYRNAFNVLSEAASIFETELDENTIPSLGVRVNLGILFMEQGKYPEAEEQFEKALNLISTGQEEYLPILNNIALVYQRLGLYERSEKAFLEIKNQEAETIGATHASYAVTLTNLSMVYLDEDKFPEAEESMLKALDIQRLNNETTTASYARKLNNLAKVYVFSGSVEKAIPLYKEALEIIKKVLSEKSVDYGTMCYNLGLAYLKLGEGNAGIKYLKKSASLRSSVLGKQHPKYAESLQKIGEYQWQKRQKKKAQLTFGQVFDNYYFQIENILPSLIEEEKVKFYYNTLKPSFDKFNSFALDYYKENPLVLGDVYNHQLNTKAVIMMATEKMNEAITQSNDTLLIEKFENWQALKEQLAKVYSHHENPGKLDSMLTAVNKIEKELARESADFAKQVVHKRNVWQDIQKTLKPTEAAVEVIRFNSYSPERGGSFDDHIIYAFLIISSNTKDHPDLVLMNNGGDMEGRSLKFLRNSIKYDMEDPYSYKAYFEPLGDYLQRNGIQKFYFSPDGVFNQINLNTIRNPFSTKYLIDEYKIIVVTTTRELLASNVTQVEKSGMLMGFPKFNVTQESVVASAQSNQSSSRGISLGRGLRGGLLRYMDADNGIMPLPGTQKEINSIAAILNDEVTVFTDVEASEVAVKDARSPQILHIATHGFFLEDEDLSYREDLNKYVLNPLLKSGLILSGAENFLKTGISMDSTGEDGILTAYEAMNLHLDKTKLVVLSACETGKGDIKNGEGVYGLQRAFKLAGAKHIVMSLWNVDDDATQQLMILFYEFLLTGDDVHEALREAQNKLRVKYPSPFYWGAFLVVGI